MAPLGGGNGVVCNVDVDSTGLVVEPSDLLDSEESSLLLLSSMVLVRCSVLCASTTRPSFLLWFPEPVTGIVECDAEGRIGVKAVLIPVVL